MKLISKKYLLLASLASAVLVTTASVAAVPSNVANTVHNFSTTGLSSVYKATASSGMTQVCVFCHTPHNPGQAKLLWNKASGGNTAFRLYTSSGTLSNITTTQSALPFPEDSPSLLCLSCHDGKTAMNILHTASSPTAIDATPFSYPAGTLLIDTTTGGLTPLIMPSPEPDLFTGLVGPSMNIGGTSGTDLTNDHPINFSYSDVYADDPVGLHDVVSAKSAGARFFGSNNRVECSTCHDPHVDTSSDISYKPFLVTSNTGSALCLSCHDK
ncbi:MAG: cytochrome c3 family protein [Desulfuromonadaceae bacterium]|nr:cytochrome c3 family protein [Desulfuromonadaceae bacterium]MDD2855818.1 cytochrome c3 family protein [Desulfuromonadaceae bacterium]